MGQDKNYPWRFSLFSMSYYVANGVQQGYISKYFKDAGMTGARLSVLMAAIPAVALLAQPLWGALGDKVKSRNKLLLFLIAFAAVVVALLGVGREFAYLLSITCLFASTFTSIQPIGDSIVLESLQNNKQPFGPIRLTGCLSFAVANVIFGLLLDGGRIRITPYLTCFMLVLLFLSTLKLPQTAGHQAQGQKMNMLALFRDKNLFGLLTLLMLLQLTLGYFYSFFSIYFTELPGGSTSLLGVCYFLSATSEVPFLLNSDKIFDKLGVGRMMAIAALLCTARWAILFFAPNAYVALGSQVLHGGGFIVMTVGMAKYMAVTVPDELKSSGQMALAVVGFGIARVFGILGGGLISEAMGGTRQGFLLMACVSGIALLIFAPIYFLKKKPLNGQTES